MQTLQMGGEFDQPHGGTEAGMASIGQPPGVEAPSAVSSERTAVNVVMDTLVNWLHFWPREADTGVSEHFNLSTRNDPNPHFDGRVV